MLYIIGYNEYNIINASMKNHERLTRKLSNNIKIMNDDLQKISCEARSNIG